MPPRRPPASVFRIVSAVSWPGVQMTTADTATKASKGLEHRSEVSRGARRCHLTMPASRALTSGVSDPRAPLAARGRRGLGGVLLGHQGAARRRRRCGRHRDPSLRDRRARLRVHPLACPRAPRPDARRRGSRRSPPGSWSSSATTCSSTSGTQLHDGGHRGAGRGAGTGDDDCSSRSAVGLDRSRHGRSSGSRVAFAGVAIVVALGSGQRPVARRARRAR